MKAVCIVTQSVYEIDPRVRRKAEALVAAGYSVDVLALRAPQGKKIYSVGGVNVRTISLSKQRGSPLRYAYEYAAFFVWACLCVSVQMARKRYAIVDVNTLPDFLIFAAVFCKGMGAKLVLDMHEITPEFYMSKYGIGENSWKVRLVKFLEKISFDFADRVLTINDPVQKLLCGRGLQQSKSIVITNAADELQFVKSVSPEISQDCASQEKFVMMYHGTLTKIYGLDIAVEAFSLVHRDMPGAELWILGDGSETGALSELVSTHGVDSKVHLMGRVPSASIPSWLSQCSVGILPIRRDVFLDFAFPNKLPEFIVAEKTVIVSRLRTIQFYFSEDALAFFEPNSAADLSIQMLRMFNDPALRARLASRAKIEYAPIRWSLMKERYLTLMDSLSGCARVAN